MEFETVRERDLYGNLQRALSVLKKDPGLMAEYTEAVTVAVVDLKHDTVTLGPAAFGESR